MNDQKYFRLYWLTGKIEIIKGYTIADAFMKAGYGGGAIHALDYYSIITEDDLTEDEQEYVKQYLD